MEMGLLSVENSFEKNVEESYDWLSVEPPLRYTFIIFSYESFWLLD